MSKKYTPLWCEVHFEDKMYKTLHDSWKLRCRKHARRCGRKNISKSKCTKYSMFELLIEVTNYIEKVHVVVARCIFQKSKVQKTDGYGIVLDVQICFSMSGARSCTPSQKSAKTWERFCSISKNDARHGTFEKNFY